jgi:hypothetical protein
MLVSVAVGGLVLGVVAQIIYFSGRSLAAILNYVDLDHKSDQTLSLMSKEIRQANSLLAATSGSITLQDADGTNLQYVYDEGQRKLSRIKGGVTTVLLTECDYLVFSTYQRNPIASSYDQYPVATPGTCKLIQVTWICSRKVLGTQVNSESVQSAKFVIRKQ